MPGFVGFTKWVTAEEHRRAVLTRMRDFITPFDSYVLKDLFTDPQISATQSDKPVSANRPAPYQQQGVYVWLDGDIFKVKGPPSSAQTPLDAGGETLCKLYLADRSLSFLPGVDGIYSAAIYDSVESKLYLITDRYGLRYLYWMEHNGGLVWSSELKAMLALPDFSPKIERDTARRFVQDGFLPDDLTWFEGTHLLPPGSYLTLDLLQRTVREETYWGWSSVQRLTGKVNEDEIADELARLLVRSVEIRWRPTERVGFFLSGGLDTRAIIAASPADRPVSCVTFGSAACLDLAFARRAARIRGASHHFMEIDAENFFKGRAAGAWWLDAQSNVLDLHVAILLSRGRDLFDILFDGFWGDVIVGGRYVRPDAPNDAPKINNRSRRYMISGPRFLNNWLDYRLPFADNDIVDLAISLPTEVRGIQNVYKKMLLRHFAPFYKSIPWLHTSLRIGYPVVPNQGIVFKHKWILKWYLDAIWRRIPAAFRFMSYVDYDSWVRRDPARSLVETILQSKGAIYPDFVPRTDVDTLWRQHLAGRNQAREVFAYLTLELWLQQVFNGNYRPPTSSPQDAWTNHTNLQ
jgi:asparagine synthase (glutamine-hydrolysing)